MRIALFYLWYEFLLRAKEQMDDLFRPAAIGKIDAEASGDDAVGLNVLCSSIFDIDRILYFWHFGQIDILQRICQIEGLADIKHGMPQGFWGLDNVNDPRGRGAKLTTLA